MFLYFLGGFALLAVGLVAFIATRPSQFRVVREGRIRATPEQVFRNINDLRRWDDWSPWAKKDPNAVLTYGARSEGAGASYTWNGNKEVGEGTLTITESVPHRAIRMKLDFVRPFKCSNDVDFSFSPDGDGTKVVWGMDGKNNFMSKAVCLVMNMDKMVGGDFEKGLNNLRSLSEASAPAK